VLAIAFLVNIPAIEVPHADLQEGTYGFSERRWRLSVGGRSGGRFGNWGCAIC
jgi:hypothetical protein